MPGIDGMRKGVPMKESQDRQRMWQAFRILRRFTSADIEGTAEVERSHCGKYIKLLLDADYLKTLVEKQSGVAGGYAMYVLIKDTGPHAPRFGKSGIFDPNLVDVKDPRRAIEFVTIPRTDYDRALACVRACQGMTDPVAEVAALRAAMSGDNHE